MVIIASKIVTEAQIQKAIAKVVKKLPKHVLSVRYNLGTDWTGDPSIYFRVVLTDEIFKTDGLAEETRHLDMEVVGHKTRICRHRGRDEIHNRCASVGAA